MKIVYEDNEKEKIEDVHNRSKLKLFDEANPDRLYSITFKVTNPGLAQHILTGLLYDQLEEMDLGIEVREINFNRIQNKDEMKEKMHKMIDDILDGEV
jgi:uncharacterized protein YfeS